MARNDAYLETHDHDRRMLRQRKQARGRGPDTHGNWSAADERVVVRYLRTRDANECGLCGQRMVRVQPLIDHVIPITFGKFDIKDTPAGPRAARGKEWLARQLHPDNLQLAHGYCIKERGTSKDPADWRHPELRPLPVATRNAGWGEENLWIPPRTHETAAGDSVADHYRDRNEKPEPAQRGATLTSG